MGFFYGQIIVTYILAFITRICKEKKYMTTSIIWSILLLIPLIAIAAFSNGVGDAGFYKHTYSLMVDGTITFELTEEFGWSLFNFILIQISTNPQTLLIGTAIITHLLNYIVFYKYSSYLELQIYLYITSGYYLVTMNGMRQCFAASMLFLASKYIVNGNFKKYLIIVLLVATIHTSALILIPLYFVVRQEAWSRQMVMFIGLAVVGILGYTYFESILFAVLENTSYGHYSEFNEGGSSAIRAIVNLVPVVLSYIKRKELKESWSESNIFVNMAIINAIFVTFGTFNWIFNRFTLYFQVYNFVLIPYIIKHCTKGKEKTLFYIGLVVCYFIFFYREQVIGLNMHYYSEYLNINDIFYNVIGY